MTTITDISNYKHCRRKQADYWMCIPPKGTIVFNKSEATYLSKQMNFLKRRSFMTAVELQQLKDKNQSLYDIVIKTGLIVKDNNSNVIIYCAETWQVVSYRHVCDNYLAYHNNKLVDINSIIKERTTNLKNEKVVDWFRVQVKQETKQYFACFVPVNESGVIPTSNGKKMPYNHTYIEHGKGDFIVCEAIGDKPNLSTASVVNGSVFPIIYDNRGWTEYITISRVNFDEPPKLWKSTNNMSNSSRPDTMIVESKNNRADISAMVAWYKKYNLKSHCEFLIKNGDSLDEDTISHIMASRKVCEYLIQRHQFKITEEQFNNTGSIRDIHYAIIVLKSEQCVINSVIPSTLSGWNNDPYSAYNDMPLEETIVSLEDLDSFVDDLIKNIPRYHLLIKALNKNKCNKDIIDRIESSMDEWYAQLDSPHFFSVDDIVGFLTEVSRVYNKYGEKEKIQVSIIDNCIKCTFLDGKTHERISFISDVDCVPEGNVNTYRGSLSRQLYQSSDWDEFIESARREECDLDNPNKNVYENIIESYYFKSDDTIYFRSKNISISCEDSFIANFINECNRSGYFRDFLKSDCDLDEYSDYKETEPSKFFRVLIGFIEKGAKAMMLRATEDIKPEDTKLANLTILGKTKVGRYFGKINYPFGDEYVNISKSTLDLIQYEYPDAVIIEPSEKKEDVDFVPLHYFQLVIRLGLFSSVFNFKHLKKLYMQYSKDIFENRLDTKTICMAGNYSNNTKFKHESVSDCRAHTKNQKYITINGRHIDLQRSELSDFTKRTLIHEMCHSYTRVLYGTARENPGEDGGTIYGISDKYKDQWWCHGKHFGEAVQFASDKTKIAFNQIFGYGLQDPYELEDSNGLTLAPKNAFDFGQRYRDTEARFIKSGDFCPVHNKVNCSCNSDNKVPFSNSRYIGRCEKCGELHTFNDVTLKKLSKEPLSYMAVVDRYGIIATSKCEKCGGKLIPVFSSDDTNVKKYLEDLDYSNRYAEHMVDIYKQNITKYANYFKNNYGCDLEVDKSNMPCLSITISNKSGFKEVFKFFLSCSEKGKLVGKLYKDYGMEYKGAFIHKFRVDTDKNVLKLLEYIMKFIRKNLKES